MSIFAKLERRIRQEVLFAVLAATVIGFLAGLTGSIVAEAYLWPTPIPATVSGIAPRPLLVDSGLPDLTKLSRSVATFYVSRSDATANGFTADAVISGGGVLTSGGWLVTTDSSRQLVKGKAVAVIDNRSYPIAELARDNYAGLTFVKLNGAENLSPAWIDGAAVVAAGSQLYGLRASGEAQRVDALGWGSRQYGLSVSGAQSSEALQRVLRVTAVDGLPIGSLLVDRRGAAVAVLSGRDADGWFAVPCAAFYRQLDEVFRKQGQIARPRLGVTYVDLAGVISPVGSDVRSRGARLIGVDGRRAVVAGSSAATAGLRSGDVIVAVENEELTATRGLADVLAEFLPGAQVNLTVERGERGADGRWPRLEVSVILGE